jgi:hypothetical protein
MELTVIVILKALTEIAGLALVGQGLLGLLAGASREKNFVYQLFAAVTAPVIRAARFVTPPFVPDRHLGLVAFFVLFWIWVALIFAKRHVCMTQNLACGI